MSRTKLALNDSDLHKFHWEPLSTHTHTHTYAFTYAQHSRTRTHTHTVYGIIHTDIIYSVRTQRLEQFTPPV